MKSLITKLTTGVFLLLFIFPIIAQSGVGKLSGKIIDADTKEELIGANIIILNTGLGASTDEAQEKVAIQIAEQISDYLSNNRISGAVNAPSVQKEIPNQLEPYVKLSEVIGLFHSQIMEGQLKLIEINFWGDDLNSISELLTASLLKGLLSRQRSERVNLINAQLLAKEEGIAVKQIKSSETRAYNNLMRVSLKSNHNLSRIIEGTVVGKNELRIINIDGFPVDFNPEGTLILYYNIDVPGILASVSTMLANEKINIAGLSLGRIEEGKEALTIIKIDSYFSTKLLEDMKSLEGIKSIYSVTI